MEDIIELTATEKVEAFTIDSEDKANWFLSKLAAIDTEKARIKAQTEQRTKELDSDRESLLFRFGSQLEAWAKDESIRRRRQTITMQQGTLAFRVLPARFTVGDMATALTTAKAVCPDAVTVQTVEKLDGKAFVAYAENLIQTTGEMIPGIEKVEAKESFSIKFPTGKGGE